MEQTVLGVGKNRQLMLKYIFPANFAIEVGKEDFRVRNDPCRQIPVDLFRDESIPQHMFHEGRLKFIVDTGLHALYKSKTKNL